MDTWGCRASLKLHGVNGALIGSILEGFGVLLKEGIIGAVLVELEKEMETTLGIRIEKELAHHV